MRATIDYQEERLKIFGQSIVNTIGSSPLSVSIPNPLTCCIPSSSSTSSFLHNTSGNFIKFTDILNVELINIEQPNEIELTFANAINQGSTSDYPTTDVRYNVLTQVLKIDDLNDRIWKGEDLVNELMKLAYPFGKADRSKILVLINPHSGKGHAMKLYLNEAEPILKAAKCQLTIEQTQYSGHARDIARDIDINKYDVILCCSGDGTPHEVLNGLYSRDDKVEAFSKLTVVQVPGGSGNAMTLSCLGTSEPSEAALRLLKGKSVQCDLMGVTGWKGESQDVLVSFLSQTYGMIAQADIGTEYLRFLGGFRFDVGVFLEAVANSKYPCELAVKWIAKDKELLAQHYQDQLNDNNNNDDDKQFQPLSEDNFNLKYADQFHATEDFLDLPSGWEVFDQTKTSHNAIFYAGKMPYIASECNFFPAALPYDGAIDIITFDGRTKLLSTAKALLSLDKGLHVWHDEVEHFKVEAFRISPKVDPHQKRYISVDGEDYPFVPFQVEVLPRVMKTILWSGGFTETGFSARL